MINQSRFTAEQMLLSVLAEDLDVIGMAKQLKQRYIYRGQSYTR